MNNKTPWERASAAEGTTASERALTRLAKKAFLSLWSYSNIFTDEGRVNGKGDGKELCDLLVVFGNDVLLFSDKDCEYNAGADLKVAWPRWYKRAIEKSAKQLAGAEKFALTFPKRIFLDKQCQTPLPVPLPEGKNARYFLIAVTRGAHNAACSYFGGGSSGSLIIRNDIRGKKHYEEPFHIGFPLESGRFIHVLDEIAVDLLLEELDTVPDLVAYLACKEALIVNPGVVVSIPEEEEILARYMATLRNGQHALPVIPAGISYVALPEGDWDSYVRSPQRAAKREADKISYLWDSIIEHQSNFIRAGTAITFPEQLPEHIAHERIVRAMAQQNRLARRQCGSDLHYVLSREEQDGVFARIHMNGTPPVRAFVFVAAKRHRDIPYQEFREIRMQYLTTYCHAIKQGIPTLQEAIGVSAEPFSDEESSFEFIYVDHTRAMSKEEIQGWRKIADELDILRPSSQVALYQNEAREFPIPFNFRSDDMVPPKTRAERRRIEREERKKKKKEK
ncbi:hypothetical protein [uncultured Herbaspirillum sp.]|uniref:hypothetical protein n=1 Tax=uncultured Herbaspirillum sp. TaxID=160236 RepID=UPI002582DBCE|nr:hypothetical protein [uncultured Herbaspirillum sp.]